MPDTRELSAAATPQALSLETALSASAVAPGLPAQLAARGPQGLWRWLCQPHGLRAGLWLLLAIGLLPALAGTTWYLQQLRALAMRDAFAQADLMANSTVEALRWQLQDAQVLMSAVAARARVRALDPADCDPMFRDFNALAPIHRALSMRRNNGESLCSSMARPPSRDSVAASTWFQAALRQPGFHVSGVHMGTVEQAWTVRLTLPVPGPTGQPEALLVSPLDLGQLHRRVFARLPAVARVAVVDHDNRLVLQSQNQDERVGKLAVAGAAREVDLLRARLAGRVDADADAQVHHFGGQGFDGPARLFSVRPVPLTDWMVVASLPEEETLQGYRSTRNRVLAAVLLVVLGVVAAAWRVSLGILVPIRGLADAARGVAGGDDSCRAPEAGPREVADVAREFNRMVQANSQARAQLLAGETQYRTLIQNLPVAVVTHRPDGSIEVFNQRACSLLQASPAQMQLRDQDWHFVDTDGRRLAPADWPVGRLLRTRQPLPPTVLGIAGNAPGAPPQPHTWVMVTGYPQFDSPGSLQRAIVAFVDVTAQRQAEALRVAKESAENASRAKSVFLSRVSHELRTPLNAINGFSELVLMDAQVPEASREKLRHVLNAGRHLLSLINQVLDLSRLESAGPPATLQPLALWPLLADCVALCGPMAQARGVALALTAAPLGLPLVLGDPTPLRQVLLNLLSNAIKYNRTEGLVHIGATLTAEGDAVLLHVRDTGPGIPADQQAALFQPFNRLGAEFSGVEGHGLGLSIARMLAQAMGGDITVQSTPGEGATFTLRLRSQPGAAA